jgi:hypothetical protein
MASKTEVTQKNPASPWDGLLPSTDQEKIEKPALLERQRTLYRYGELLEKNQLEPEYAAALGKALKAIALGENAEEVLFGQRIKRGGELLGHQMRLKFALKLIASLVDKAYGPGLSRKEAIRRASIAFGFKESTLRNYWNSARTDRSPMFNIP